MQSAPKPFSWFTMGILLVAVVAIAFMVISTGLSQSGGFVVGGSPRGSAPFSTGTYFPAGSTPQFVSGGPLWSVALPGQGFSNDMVLFNSGSGIVENFSDFISIRGHHAADGSVAWNGLVSGDYSNSAIAGSPQSDDFFIAYQRGGTGRYQLEKYSLPPVGGNPVFTYDWVYSSNETSTIHPNNRPTISVAPTGDPVVLTYHWVGALHVKRFHPNSNVPYSDQVISGTNVIGINSGPRAVTISADGRWLSVLGTGAMKVFDLSTPTPIMMFNSDSTGELFGYGGSTSGAESCMASNPDSSVISFGVWRSTTSIFPIVVLERNTQNQYAIVQRFTDPTFSTRDCRMAISTDGSVIAYAARGGVGNVNHHRIRAFTRDGASWSSYDTSVADDRMLTDTVNPASLNFIFGLSMSEDGKRFVVGSGSDGAGSPELLAYGINESANAPIEIVDLPGGVANTDISATGDKTYFLSRLNGAIITPGGSVHLDDMHVSARTLPDYLPYPTNFSAGDGSLPNSIRSTWSPAPGAISYDVKRNTTPTETGIVTVAPGITGLSFANTVASGVVPGALYYYSVVANYPNGSSGHSQWDSGYVLAPPAAFSFTQPGSTLNINWTNPNSSSIIVGGVELFYNTTGAACAGTQVSLGNVTNTSLQNLPLNTLFYFSAVTRGASGGMSACSPVVSYRTPQNVQAQRAIVPPESPSGLMVSTMAGNLQLNWMAPASGNVPTGYRVWRSTSTPVNTSGSPFATVNGAGTTTYLDSTGATGTTYYFAVTAFNGGGGSSPSNEASGVPTGCITGDSPNPQNTSQCVRVIRPGPNGGDGMNYATSAVGETWSQLQAMSSGVTSTSANWVSNTGSQRYDNGTYRAYRTFLVFNVSSLANKTLRAGRVEVVPYWVIAQFVDAASTIYAVPSTQLSPTNLTTADFGRCGYTASPLTTPVALTSMSVLVPVSFPLTTSGTQSGMDYLSTAIPNTYAKFCMIEGHSPLASFSSTSAQNVLSFYTSEQNTPESPALIVTYDRV